MHKLNRNANSQRMIYPAGRSGFCDSRGDSKLSNTVNLGYVPGRATIKNMLLAAAAPVGKTMYVWGGGWNSADTGAGEEAVSIGLSPHWEEFCKKQSSSYDFRQTKYKIHDGLDCSGYIGWIIYNTLNTQSKNEGYVCRASDMARMLAEKYGMGRLFPCGSFRGCRPGDIMSGKNHVYMVIGMCRDESSAIVHSSPPGVRLCSLPRPDGMQGEARGLVRRYMSECCPNWYERFPDCEKDISYRTDYCRMSWCIGKTISDPDGYRQMYADEILNEIRSCRASGAMYCG